MVYACGRNTLNINMDKALLSPEIACEITLFPVAFLLFRQSQVWTHTMMLWYNMRNERSER